MVFQRLREKRLKVPPSKSEFLRQEVEFLQHLITPEAIKPNPRKIVEIKKFLISRTAREMKSILALLRSYRRFMKKFKKLQKPLQNVRIKEKKMNSGVYSNFPTLQGSPYKPSVSINHLHTQEEHLTYKKLVTVPSQN